MRGQEPLYSSKSGQNFKAGVKYVSFELCSELNGSNNCEHPHWYPRIGEVELDWEGKQFWLQVRKQLSVYRCERRQGNEKICQWSWRSRNLLVCDCDWEHTRSKVYYINQRWGKGAGITPRSTLFYVYHDSRCRRAQNFGCSVVLMTTKDFNNFTYLILKSIIILYCWCHSVSRKLRKSKLISPTIPTSPKEAFRELKMQEFCWP